MKTKIHLAAALLGIVICGCATTIETAFVPGDSSGWKLGYGSDRRGRTIAEYVPHHESIDNWSRLLTIQFLEGERSSPLAVMERLRSRIQTRCPGASWSVIRQETSSVLYEWKISGCPGNPDQNEIARLLRGNDGVHRIAYVEKVLNMATAERDKWVNAFSNAYVVKGGQRVVLAP